MPNTQVPTIELLSGASMPGFGFGTGGRRLSNEAAPAVVRQAIEAGYRLFDTAENYGNEQGVGAGIRESGIARDEIFITTKLNARWHGLDGVARAFEASAARLGLDTIDLFMIHWPNPAQDRYVEAWKGMIRLREAGHVRAIGMSNFKPVHLDRIMAETGVVPDVNQIELNPYVTREAERAYHRRHGIVTQSWAPLGKAGPLLAEPVVAAAAARHGRSPSQVVLRWIVENGVVPQPGSLNPAHMAENLAALDFSLTPEEVTAIAGLNGRQVEITDSDVFGH